MMTTHTQFFGDKDHDFKLTPALIVELERLTETGVGALAKRLFSGEFRYSDMIETIRLGLIGGGASPQQAAGLIRTYAQERPLTETLPLAIAILEKLWFGDATPEADVEAAQ